MTLAASSQSRTVFRVDIRYTHMAYVPCTVYITSNTCVGSQGVGVWMWKSDVLELGNCIAKSEARLDKVSILASDTIATLQRESHTSKHFLYWAYVAHRRQWQHNKCDEMNLGSHWVETDKWMRNARLNSLLVRLLSIQQKFVRWIRCRNWFVMCIYQSFSLIRIWSFHFPSEWKYFFSLCIIACGDESSDSISKSKIKKKTEDPSIRVYWCDLESFNSL